MTHLLHSCALALVFYLLYRYILKGSQAFQMYRWYLLALPVLSFLLPLLVIPIENTMVSSAFKTGEIMTETPVIIDTTSVTKSSIQEAAFDPMTLVFYIYLAGVAIALLLFMYKLARIYQWKDEGKTVYKNGCYITAVHKLPTAFSFLNHIFINNAVAKEQYDQILLHEMTHVREKHSWDLLFYEFLRIVFWFHPVSYLAQQDLKLIHEHIADQRTIAVHGKESYYENLLRQVLDCPDFSFTNAFFKLKTIKTRLIMINSSQPRKFAMRKLLWILPVLFASLTYTACTTELEETDEAVEKTFTVEELPTLQDHVYGQKEFYKGVTDEEKAILEQMKPKMEKYFVDPNVPEKNWYAAYKEFEKDPAFDEYRRITSKISRNGNTVVRDAENNNYVLTIHEYQYGSPRYSGTGPLDQAKMSRAEYSDFIKKQKNQYENYIDQDSEVIEEKVEVEKVNKKSTTQQEIADVPFAIIDEVPTYPGCSGTNAEKKKCMQESITRFVNENFNTGLASKLGLTGKQSMVVQFKITNSGEVTDIVSRAKHPKLQEEAARVINQLPAMEPGMQKGQPVGVIYGLPINFEVN